jgi:hypothetical protein
MYLLAEYIYKNKPYNRGISKNHDILAYLKGENMIVDINDLGDINPFTIGFLQNIIPRHETIRMHTMRLTDLLPYGSPKFQLQYESLWGKTGERAWTLLIKCNEGNREVLVKYFKIFTNKRQYNIFLGQTTSPAQPNRKLHW